MTAFEVAPLPRYEEAVLDEFRDLPLACADGFETLVGRLEEREPALRDRAGLMADRHEIYTIPLPDCAQRRLVLSIDCRDPARPRLLHGTLPQGDKLIARARDLARLQLGLADPAWEPAQP